MQRACRVAEDMTVYRVLELAVEQGRECPFGGPILEAGRASGSEARPAQYSSDVKSVEGHHLGPGLHEVVHKPLLSVGGGIDLRHCAQFGVRTKPQVNRGRRPLERAGLAIVSLVYALGRG